MWTDTKIGTGITGLDDILGGGIPACHLYLVEGDPGAGKTTLAMQFLLAGAQAGEKVLYVTLSESEQELRAVGKSHGWNLDGITIFELLPEEDHLRPEGQYTVFHPSEVELADTTHAILERVGQASPRRVVIDSLSELRMLAGDALRYRRQILALKRFFLGRECTVLMLDDRLSSDPDLQLRSVAHGVLTLENLSRDYGVKRRRMEVVKLRAARFREGYHDYNILTGGLEVYPRLIAAEHRPAFQPGRLPSGIAELDSLWGGGIDRGTSTLIMGPAGSGKSTIAAHYAFAAAERGEHPAVFMFDEGMQSYFTRLDSLGMGVRDLVASKRMTVEQIDPAELGPGEFASRIRHQATNLHSRVIVIDSLNGLLNAMPGEQYLTIQLHELLTFLNQQGVATFMVLAQHGLLGQSMVSSVDVSYLADSVLLLRYFEWGGKVKQAVSVLKKRTGAHERSIRELDMHGGIRIGAPLLEFRGVLTGVPVLCDDKPATREGDAG